MLDAKSTNNYNATLHLCFEPSVFLKESFSIDDFLRNHKNKATLEVLRNDLGIYLKDLRLSMIELINKDYEDFVNLSKDLVGLNMGIEALHNPLNSVKLEVNLVRSNLQDAIVGMQKCLQQTNSVRRKKQSLFHLSQVITSMKKMKTLLYEDKKLIASNNLDFIERVTAEYTILQFSISKCREILSGSQKTDNSAIEKTLMDLLKNSFLAGMCERDSNHLRRCLRMFVRLDKVKEAEELVQKEIVVPVLYDLINESSLKKDPDEIKGLYQRVNGFIDDQLTVLLTLSVDLNVNFLVNSLWIELAKRLELHTSLIFSAGDPDIFHTRYIATRQFLDDLRLRCSPEQAIQFDCHPQTIHFLQKWNLQVYYKIRFQEIAGQLEWTLCEDGDLTWEGSDYHLKIPAVTMMCLERCWDDKIFLPQLLHSFWKLSLQILARYCKWISKYLNQEPTSKTIEPGTSGLTSQLEKLIWLHSDTSRILLKADSLLTNVKLRKAPMDSSLKDGRDMMVMAISEISTCIEDLIVEKSVGSLSYVRDIPRLFRRTNRENPTKPCDYVNQLLEPIQRFHLKYKSIVSEKTLKPWMSSVLTKVSSLYFTNVSEVLDNAQKTEESLRRLKKANAKFTNNIENKGPTDDDKIRQQLVVDIHYYCESVQALELGNDAIPQLQELVDLVEKARGRLENQ